MSLSINELLEECIKDLKNSIGPFPNLKEQFQEYQLNALFLSVQNRKDWLSKYFYIDHYIGRFVSEYDQKLCDKLLLLYDMIYIDAFSAIKMPDSFYTDVKLNGYKIVWDFNKKDKIIVDVKLHNGMIIRNIVFHKRYFVSNSGEMLNFKTIDVYDMIEI